MNWNHRIVKIKDGDGPGKDILMLAEVFYNEDGTPAGYSAPFMHSESIGGLEELVNRLTLALTHPILNSEDMLYVEQPLDDEDDSEMTRADVIRELAESVGVTLIDVKMPDDCCALCGRAEPCDDCKGAA